MERSGETLDNLLINILVLHKELGFCLAWDNWNTCFDPDNKSDKSQHAKGKLVQTQSMIEKVKTHLSRLLNDEEFKLLLTECAHEMESYQETIEQDIEIKHRPSEVYFNKDAVIICTNTPIPIDIQMNLSFGYKFLSPYVCHDGNMPSILAQLEQCMSDSVPVARYAETSLEIHQILSHRDSVQKDDNKNWLRFISYRTEAFFKNQPNLFATKSDKGGHTVIMDVSDYESKLELHIDEGNYALVNLDQAPLIDLIEKERILVKNLRGIKNLEDFFKSIRHITFEPNTLLIPKFYGLPKIHKPGSPLRPITSTVGSVGYYLAKVFDRLIKGIFPCSDIHIRDTYKFINFINNVRVNSGEVLVSFDVVSMFSSIPYELVSDIIMKKANTFHLLYGIDRGLLSSILSFTLKDCMIFSALGKNYRQLDGLPMGSCLSPTVARIVMDHIVADLLVQVPQISLIKVFVDDTIAKIHKDYVGKALEVLNNFRPGQIKFTLECENNLQSINFLNVTLTRCSESISTNWFRKSFASGRLLNYFSSHKRTTVIATAAHFIRTVLSLSDPEHFHNNKPIITQTLRDNSFPETTIEVLMNEFYTYMKPLDRKKEVEPITESQLSIVASINNEEEEDFPEYAIFPHSICKGRDIKRVICSHKNPGTTLADSVRNTKVNSITTRKTATPIEKRKNLILISQCICKEKYIIDRTRFNETGEMALHRILTLNKQGCDKYSHAYKKARFHKGLFYGSQTSYLCRYMQWSYRHKLDVHCCKFEYPIERFGRLIKCSCCNAD